MFKNLNPSALGITGHQSEIIELALTFGFKGMDLNIMEFAGRAKSKGVEYAKRLIESAGIRIGTFSLPLDWEAEDDVFQKGMQNLPEFAAYAAALGCTRATALLSPAGDARPSSVSFRHSTPPRPEAKVVIRHGPVPGSSPLATMRSRTGVPSNPPPITWPSGTSPVAAAAAVAAATSPTSTSTSDRPALRTPRRHFPTRAATAASSASVGSASRALPNNATMSRSPLTAPPP